MDISVTLLDSPEALQPTYAIWASSRLSWLQDMGRIVHYEDQGPDSD